MGLSFRGLTHYPRCVRLRLALAKTYGHMASRAGGFRPLAWALVVRVSRDSLFFSVQQSMLLGGIVDGACGKIMSTVNRTA